MRKIARLPKVCEAKDCPLKGIAQPLSAFGQDGGLPGGYSRRCKACVAHAGHMKAEDRVNSFERIYRAMNERALARKNRA